MKLPSLTLLAILSVASGETLRSSALNVEENDCNSAASEKACFDSKDEAGNTCVWCDCQAVPSVCVSPGQAKDLPSGVFQCKTPGLFQFAEDRVHHLKEHKQAQGDDDFCDASSKSISGYMDIKGSKYDENGENKHLFFWMFEKRNSNTNTEEEQLEQEEIPFVVWLTGGPGCSSTLALLTENGPCSVNPDGKTTSVNPYSWTEAAHVLWLDQPAGVGFSYGDENDSGEEMISEDAFFFLQAFFQTHPEYAKSPLFIIGESYGGVSAAVILCLCCVVATCTRYQILT